MNLDATEISSADAFAVTALGSELKRRPATGTGWSPSGAGCVERTGRTRALGSFKGRISLSTHSPATVKLCFSTRLSLIAPTRGLRAASIDCGAGFRPLRNRPYALLALAPGRTYQLRWQGRPQVLMLTISAAELGALLDEWGVETNALFDSLSGVELSSQFVHALMHRLWEAAALGSSMLTRQLLCAVAAELYTTTLTSERASMRGGLAAWQANRVIEYAESHLDTNVTLRDLAQLIDLSPAHFCRAFKQTVGESPMRYLSLRRMERAKQLLAETQLRVIDVAAACGYDCPSQFASVFRRSTGNTPTEWRRA